MNPERRSALVVTVPRGLEEALLAELDELGVEGVHPAMGAIQVEGGLKVAYRICLWSRVANRVLLPIAHFPVPDEEALYQAAREVCWLDHLGPESSLAVDPVVVGRATLTNSHFAALRVKDAIVDTLRTATGQRPDVQLDQPDVRINLFVNGVEGQLAIDLSGESLHRRGYRQRGVAAPLKENLAAGLLLLAGWPEALEAEEPLLDPMCGSGTFPTEAALLALDVAPGLDREPERWGFTGWRGHNQPVWQEALSEAAERDLRVRAHSLPPIVGYDEDGSAIATAWRNLRAAGVDGVVHVERRDLREWHPPQDADAGLMVINPPYGERLGRVSTLSRLYRTMGDVFKDRFGGWTVHILSGDRALDGEVGLRPNRRLPVYNGPIECRWLRFPIRARKTRPVAEIIAETGIEAGVTQFEQRLRKRCKHLGKWARRQDIHCYRVYDADLQQFAVAIDRYEDRVHVQEYQAPASVDPKLARARLAAVLDRIPQVMEVPPEQVHLKVRRRQRGSRQYTRLRQLGQLLIVREGGHRFYVNLTDYLDTGLFLDHRETRGRVQELAAGRHFLNLFAYTGTATVYAAKGGALTTTTVDLSNTYLDWARKNLILNDLQPGSAHRIVRADCLSWLKAEPRRQWGLIFLDPPSFSNSRATRGTFDVERDHVWLLRATARMLRPDGVLYFSTNKRRFQLEQDALPELWFRDLTRATLPQDFERQTHPRQLWQIEHRRE